MALDIPEKHITPALRNAPSDLQGMAVKLIKSKFKLKEDKPKKKEGWNTDVLERLLRDESQPKMRSAHVYVRVDNYNPGVETFNGHTTCPRCGDRYFYRVGKDEAWQIRSRLCSCGMTLDVEWDENDMREAQRNSYRREQEMQYMRGLGIGYR